MNFNIYRNGYSLIELLIAVCILGIVSVISYSSYQDTLHKTHRLEIKAILYENAQFMERFFTLNNSYDKNSESVTSVIPFTVSPKNATGNKVMYTISFQDGKNSTSYTLQAVPVNAMENDGCGIYILNNLGQQKNLQAATNYDPQNCWN